MRVTIKIKPEEKKILCEWLSYCPVINDKEYIKCKDCKFRRSNIYTRQEAIEIFEAWKKEIEES